MDPVTNPPPTEYVPPTSSIDALLPKGEERGSIPVANSSCEIVTKTMASAERICNLCTNPNFPFSDDFPPCAGVVQVGPA